MFGLFPEDKNSTHQTAQVTSNFHLLGNFASCIGEWARTKGKPRSVKSFGNIKFMNDPYDKEILVSKETVVLRRWERSKQKFGFIKRVDKG